jgi:hypothetical protein
MQVNAEDKALDALRTETIDRLIMNYGHGALSLQAFERRLDQAFDATEGEALEALTADLDLDVDSAYIERKKGELGLQSRRDDKAVEHVINIASAGSERKGAWSVPKEVRVITIFGATDIDFSDAKFTSNETRVKLLCVFGAVDIFVREDVNTTIKTFCVFGAVDNQVPASEDRAATNLVVEGFVLFGAVDAKIRRTLKERLVQFAGGLRALFSAQPRPVSFDAYPNSTDGSQSARPGNASNSTISAAPAARNGSTPR